MKPNEMKFVLCGFAILVIGTAAMFFIVNDLFLIAEQRDTYKRLYIEAEKDLRNVRERCDYWIDEPTWDPAGLGREEKTDKTCEECE